MFGFCNRISLPLVKIEYLDTQLLIIIVYWLIVDRMIYLNIFLTEVTPKAKGSNGALTPSIKYVSRFYFLVIYMYSI